MQIELTASALPIWMDEQSHALSFKDGLCCRGDGRKKAGQMKNLLRQPEGVDDDEPCYAYYRDIAFDKHRPLLEARHLRYDITVIEPGTLCGERKKTSGHYHGLIEGSRFSYPEVYEVLYGSALYILQKVIDFERDEPKIDDLKAVFVEAGQAIVIPPFYGHCSINAGKGPLVFSNIAVPECPLAYEPIAKKHGLALYAMDDHGAVALEPNQNYQNLPAYASVRPRENPAMGIRFGHSVYRAVMDAPDAFDYMRNPEPYLKAMDDMLAL